MADDDVVYVSDMTIDHPFNRAGYIAKELNRPYETMQVVAGPRILSFSTRGKKNIAISQAYVMRQLESSHIPLKDVTAIIHNHPEGQRYGSSEDLKAMQSFQGAGFQGKYSVYARGKFVPLNDREKKK